MSSGQPGGKDRHDGGIGVEIDMIEKIDIIDDLNIRRYRSNDINESIKVILKELEALGEL